MENEKKAPNIFEKLSNIQQELKAPKNQFNKFGGYNYRSAEDILEAVKPICARYGTVCFLSDKVVNIGERYYVEATATLRNIEDILSIEVTAYAREDEDKKGMDGSQITGSTSSYARKYALNGLFAIDDTKDPDGYDNGNNGPNTPPPQKDAKKAQKKEEIKQDNSIAPELAKEIRTIAETKGYGEDILKKIVRRDFKKDTIESLTQGEGFSLKASVKAAPKNA